MFENVNIYDFHQEHPDLSVEGVRLAASNALESAVKASTYSIFSFDTDFVDATYYLYDSATYLALLPHELEPFPGSNLYDKVPRKSLFDADGVVISTYSPEDELALAASTSPPCSVLVAAHEARKKPATISINNFFNIIINLRVNIFLL